eukprot:332925_1
MLHHARALRHPLSVTFTMLLITINIKQIISQDIDCYNTTQCVGQSLNTDGLVWSDGYKSSFGPSTHITADSGVLCRGAFSCNSVSSLISESHLVCRGASSCSNIKHIEVTNGPYNSVYCYGANSCEFSIFRKAKTVYCYGEKSCSNSLFMNVPYIEGYGAFSLYNATIYSTNSLSVNLYGEQSGFSAQLLCQSGDVCNINCAGNGCLMMYIECNGNCIINKETSHTSSPITHINLFDIHRLNLFYDSSSMNTANDHLCSTQSIHTFDNFKERFSGHDIVINNGGAICCRGHLSCNRIKKIQSSNNNNNPIICSGDSSCGIVEEITNNGDIICSGYSSCSSGGYIQNINTPNNVYCEGQWSCSWGIISAANIYCSGYESCRYCTISSNGDINIFFIGYDSALSSEIYCNKGNVCRIFCGVTAGCSSINMLQCDGVCYQYVYDSVKRILCNVHDPCLNKTLRIINESTVIRCDGTGSCLGLLINVINVTDIYLECQGHGSCLDIEFNIESANYFEILCNSFVDIKNDVNINGAVCKMFVVDIKSVINVLNISCIGDYGCNSLYIDTGKTENVNIIGDGYEALNNLSVYGVESDKINIKCWSDYFDGKTCSNLKFYLSIKENSNVLQCRFGCNKIELFFKNDINMKLFENIQIYECSLCVDIKDCIQKWIIHYNDYNSSLIYNGS